nr:hypothetical protein [uncultured Pseudomonas sp.]
MLDFDVTEILQIENRITIFTGKIVGGEVHIGDNVALVSGSGKISFTVKRLEPNGFRHSGAKAGCNVAIVTEYLELSPFAGSMRWTGGHYESQSLKILSDKIDGAA